MRRPDTMIPGRADNARGWGGKLGDSGHAGFFFYPDNRRSVDFLARGRCIETGPVYAWIGKPGKVNRRLKETGGRPLDRTEGQITRYRRQYKENRLREQVKRTG